MSFAIGMAIRRGNIAESAIAGLAGGYGNIGYMGPGLALATLGAQAAVPVALIFCFDNICSVHAGAVPDGAGAAEADERAGDRARSGQARRAAIR